MKRFTILTALLAVSAAAQADSWNLDSCISYAVEHNLQVQSSRIEHLQGEASLTEAKDRFLPTVSASAGQNWDFGRGLTSENTYANRNTSMTNFNLGLSLPVFQGLSTVRQIDYAKARLVQLVEQVEATRDNITLNVIAQYLQVLYAGEIADVAREQLRISRVMLDRQETLLANGKVAEADVIQARAQVAADELTVVTSDNDRSLALVDLARLLELDDMEGFDISPVDGDTDRLFSPDDIYARALETNHAIRAARQGLTVADKSVSLAKSGYLPRLSFSAGLGSSYYNVNGFDNAGFSKQMRDNFSKSLGFSLQVPIFDALSTRNSVRRARIEQTSARLQLEQQESQLFKDIRQAYYQAVAAAKKLEASKVSAEASKAALEAMTYKYEYGKATASEYEQAKTNYVKACSETVQARYELMLRNRILSFYNGD